MVNPRFLSNPTLADFPHLLQKDVDVRKKIRIDVERGIVETDTLDEAKEATQITANLAEARKAAAQVGGIASVLPVSKCGITLRQAADGYLAEKEATLKGTTHRKWKALLGEFIEFAGNLDVAMVDSEIIRNFKKKLLTDKRAATTINDKISILNGFFDYCIDNKVAKMENPAKGLFIVGARNKAESYKPFSDAELKKIFQPELYIKKMKLPDFYWGPLLALFTGARAEEIASLTLEQIYATSDGIWLIDILEGKTANAVRKVPIHEQLISLGFLDYVQALRLAGYKMLFPHLVDGKNGYKKNMTRMFGEYLDLPEVSIVDPLKVFHSFRHTVVTALTNAGVNEGLKRAMVGHDINTQTSAHDDYTHLVALTIPNLQIAINKLHYKEIEFAALRVSSDVFLSAVKRRIKQQAGKDVG